MGNKSENKISKDKVGRTAAQTAVLMAILTLISKCFGFVRELVVAALFGTNYVVDSYVMAQSIPGMLVAGILGAVSTAFLPMFSDKTEGESPAAGRVFVNDVLNLLVKVSVVVTIFGIILSPQLVSIFAPGFTGEQRILTIFFLRISFLYLVFSASNSLITRFLEYNNVFLPQIMFGYLQNFIVICFAVMAAYINKRLWIFGLLISYILIYFLLLLLAKKFSFKRVYSLRSNGIAKEIMALALPVFIGGYVTTINTYVDRMLASGLPEGSVSALYYGNIIVGLITGLSVSIITTITLPRLNQARAQGDLERYNEMLYTGFNLYAIIGIPFGMGAMVFSNEVVQVIYERGAFDEGSTVLTAVALLWYGPYLCFSSMNYQSIYAFQTNKDMKTPMYIGFVSVAVNVGLNLLLVRIMGLGGLALATSVASLTSLVISIAVLRRKYPQLHLIESWRKLFVITAAAAFSVGLGWLSYRGLAAAVWMPRVCYLVLAVCAAGAAYLVLLYIGRISELKLVGSLVKRG